MKNPDLAVYFTGVVTMCAAAFVMWGAAPAVFILGISISLGILALKVATTINMPTQ